MQKAAIKPATILSLIEKELPPQPLWINPILPKSGVLLFGGEAKIGKSFILTELARALTTGSSPFGCDRMQVYAPIQVLYVEQEIGEYGLQKRMRSIFAGEDKAIYGPKLWYVSKVRKMQLDQKEGREILFDLVQQVKPNVLILDPIGRMQSYNENASNEIQCLFNTLEALIDANTDQEMSIMLAHHFVKPSGDKDKSRDPLDPYNFRGSAKFKDNPDTLVTVVRTKFIGPSVEVPYKAWEMKVRFEARQDEGLPDIKMTFNRDGDLKVKFDMIYGNVINTNSKPVDTGKKQLKFAI